MPPNNGGDWEALVKFIVQRHKLTKTDLIIALQNTFRFSITCYHQLGGSVGKCPTSAQVMILKFMSLSPTLGSVLKAQSLEPRFCVSFSFCPSPARALSLKTWINIKKNLKKEKQKVRRLKNGAIDSRTVAQFQNVSYIHNRNISRRRKRKKEEKKYLKQ